MTSWIVKIGKDFPQHWSFAVEDGFWDVRRPGAFKRLRADDDVFFWLTGGGEAAGLQGWVRVMRPPTEITAGMPRAHWVDVDSGGYTHRFSFELVSDKLRRPPSPSWAELQEIAGRKFSAQAPANPIEDADVEQRIKSLFTAQERRTDMARPHRKIRPFWTGDISETADAADTTAPYRPELDEDQRDTAMRAVSTRRGQAQFRAALLEAYGGVCAVTGCRVVPVLEAAHIDPFNGDMSQHVSNGLLLRSDLHTLFDLFQIAIDTDMTIRVAPDLADSEYGAYEGQALSLPADPRQWPDPDALARHRKKWNRITT